MPDEESIPPSDREILDSTHEAVLEIMGMVNTIERVINRVEPLLGVAEGLAKTKARFTGWTKK